MPNSDHAEAVLAKFPADCKAHKIESLGSAGGFSGAHFWQFIAPRGTLCLRRWPKPHPTTTRLEFIHGLLQHVEKQGFRKVPVPIQDQALPGASYIQHSGYLWELAPWLPGSANYADFPSVERLQEAMQALAQFHLAATSFSGPANPVGPAPAILERLELIDRWRSGERQRLSLQIDQQDSTAAANLHELGKEILVEFDLQAPKIAKELVLSAEQVVPIQPCIRDIWQQHVLFQGEQVSGIVDFGAARPDTISTDIARLLGSLAADKTSDWQIGLEAYAQIRPLTQSESFLLGPLDRSASLLSGLNWLRWIYLENRSFDNIERVELRLAAIFQRLQKMRE